MIPTPASLILSLTILGTITSQGKIATAQSPIHLLIPAYGNPCCDAGQRMWQQIMAAAADTNHSFELHVVLNPASGPGVQRDPNYLSADGRGLIKDVRDRGVRVYGYVSTGYGKRSETEITQDIDGYLKDVALYAGCVDGIFFDEVSTDLANVTRHQRLVQYVMSMDSSLVTIGNAGVTATMNPTKQSDLSIEDYATVFDVLLSFEQNSKTYEQSFEAPRYEGSHVKFAHIVHSLQHWDQRWLELAQQRGAQYVYFTDAVYQNSTDNPYNRLSSYWLPLLEALNGISQGNPQEVSPATTSP